MPGAVSGLGVALVPVGQLLLLACLLTALYAPDRAVAGVLPTRASVRQLAGVLTDGMAEMREQATPALALTGLLALTTLFLGLVAVVADLVAVAARQAALGGDRAAGPRLRPGDDDLSAASGWSRSPPPPPPSPSCCGPTRTGGCRRAAAPRARSSGPASSRRYGRAWPPCWRAW